MGLQEGDGRSCKATKASAGELSRLTGGNLADAAALMAQGSRNQHNVGGKDHEESEGEEHRGASDIGQHVCLLLQDLEQNCLRVWGGILEDMC